MINRIVRQGLLLLCLALLAATPCHAEKREDELVSLNFVNADIQEVIRAISQISKRNFIVDPRVKGTINIVSATPVSPALGYDILLSALRLQGYAAVESAGVTKIIPEADAKLHIDSLSAQGRGDKLVTHVFILKYESASQLVNIVRPMIAPNSVVVAYPSSNALVVTDYASSVKRIEKLIDSIDQPNADAPLVIPVKHASAVDLANIINKLMPETAAAQSTGQGGMDDNQRFVLVADSRTNALLLRSDNPGRIARVKELVARMDSAANMPGNIHVVTLKNADATKLAQTLRSVMSGDTSSLNATSTPGSLQPAAIGSASGGGIIQADPASNTLIVTASEPVYNNIRAVIEKLDVRRPQIFVEALIVEVTADKAAEFGVQWQNLTGINKSGANIIGGTNFGTTGNIIGASGNITSVGQGLNVGIVNGMTTIPGAGAGGAALTVLNLGMLAKALETDTNANILSAPNLMTLDNEEAKIVVGQNVPFVTGSYAQTGSATTATPFQTIERKDVGLTLKIKPQIMQGGTVKLQIYQEVSSVITSSVTSTSGPTTNKRSIESNIMVDDNQIVVLGGLISDTVNDVQSKTPLLGDIPILGNLFRYETRTHLKTNLMVFIRPYVMYQQDGYRKITDERYDMMDKKRQEARMPDHWILPNDDKDKSLPPKPEKPAAAPEAAPAASAPAAAPEAASAPAAAPTAADPARLP